MSVKKLGLSLLAALALSWVPAVYAADNGTEFGIEDDLTVLGTGGTALDPDLEIKGFSVFGATQASPALQIPPAPGNVFLNGYIQVSSGMYVAGSSTFTADTYFAGVSSFTAGIGTMYIKDGTDGQVMVKDGATGALKWGTVSAMVSGDNLGNHIATATLQMGNFGIVNVASITANGYITTYSSMTVGGDAGVGGDADLNAKLNVDGASTFVSSMTAQGNVQLGDAVTDTHGVNMAPAADTGLSIAGQNVPGDYVAKFYSGALLSAWIRKK